MGTGASHTGRRCERITFLLKHAPALQRQSLTAHWADAPSPAPYMCNCLSGPVPEREGTSIRRAHGRATTFGPRNVWPCSPRGRYLHSCKGVFGCARTSRRTSGYPEVNPGPPPRGGGDAPQTSPLERSSSPAITDTTTRLSAVGGGQGPGEGLRDPEWAYPSWAPTCGACPPEAGVAPAYHTRGSENAHPTKAGPPRGHI